MLIAKAKKFLDDSKLTNFYILFSLGLMGIIAKIFLIYIFNLNMSLFWTCYCVCVSIGCIILILKIKILNKINNEPHLKCIRYQTLVFISFLQLLLITVIILLIWGF